MNTPAYNNWKSYQSTTPLKAAFPKIVPLSQQERNHLNKSIKQLIFFWVGAGTFIWLLITLTGGWNFPSLEMMSEKDWFVMGAILLVYLGCATYSITQPLIDAKNGIKQVGMIEVTSTFSAGTSNKARFRWLGGEESGKTNPSLYGNFEPGDKAYLEYLPHSEIKLVFEKVEPDFPHCSGNDL